MTMARTATPRNSQATIPDAAQLLAPYAVATHPANTPPSPTTLWIDADRSVDIMRPDWRAIDIRFLAATLARINRYNGRTALPLSVAQHSIHVARLLPARLRRHGLLHDGHEAILGDITAPMKAALRLMSPMSRPDPVGALESAWDAAIHRALSLPWPLSGDDAALIKAADLRALATEMRDLMDIPVNRLPVAPDPHPLRPMPWAKAEEAFLTEWQRLSDAAQFTDAGE